MSIARKKIKEAKPTKKEAANDDKLLRECVNSADDWFKYANDPLQRARDYLTFLYVDQWDFTVRKAREVVGRPCMQFNKITTIIRSICGEQRDNSPSPMVIGIGKGISQDAVDLREGLLRQVHYDSNADIIYQLALKSMLEVGWGAARVCTKYEDENSFNQIPYVEPIVDIQCAWFDPSAQLPDKSDGDECGVYTTITRDHFKRIYPNVEQPQSLDTSGAYFFQWYTVETITMAERYYKEYFTKSIVQLSDGTSVEKNEADEIMARQEEYLAANPDALLMGFKPLEIVNEREAQDYKIKYVKFIQNKILEKKDYPGRLLPIVYFPGDTVVIDGECIPIPYIQDAIDNQKLINYLGSELAYAVLRARKETIIGTADNFKGYEDEWRNSDQVQGPLLYSPDRNGVKPEFIKPPVFNEQLISLYQNTVNDLQQNIGWFDEAQGKETNAISGRAIDSRKSASKKPANVYVSNQAQGIKRINQIILDLAPHLYDSERTIMVRGKDGVAKAVEINKRMGFKIDENGEIAQNVVNDMSYGKYDVEIRVDGSFDAQNAQAMNVMLQLASTNPQISNLIPDLLAEVSGLENTQQLVERLKTLVPPDIIAKEEGKPLPPPPSAPPPDPMVEVQKQKNMVAMAQDRTRNKQLALDEQKIILQAHESGLEHQATMAKAMAEIRKSHNEKDIALIDHASKLAETHHKNYKTLQG